MVTNFKQWGIEEYAAKLIKHKARQLVRAPGFTISDREDIQQDLIVALLENLPKYDSSQASRETFITKIIDSAVCNLLRHRRSISREAETNALSLNVYITDEEGQTTERVETISAEDHDRFLGRHGRPTPDDVHVQVDLEQAVAKLTPKLRRLYELLRTETVAGAARKLNLPRTTVWDSVIELRNALNALGIAGFSDESAVAANEDRLYLQYRSTENLKGTER